MDRGIGMRRLFTGPYKSTLSSIVFLLCVYLVLPIVLGIVTVKINELTSLFLAVIGGLTIYLIDLAPNTKSLNGKTSSLTRFLMTDLLPFL